MYGGARLANCIVDVLLNAFAAFYSSLPEQVAGV
jgi:hypothetical protein